MTAVRRGRDLLVGDIVANNAEAVPNRPAAVLGDEVLTFGDMERLGNRTARALAARGVGLGDRVVTWAGTTLHAVPLFAGLAKLGAVYAPMNGGLSAGEVEGMVRLARPVLVVADDAHVADAAALADAVGAGCVGIAALAAEAAGYDDEAVREERLGELDPHVVFFTSGSTGAPKGVVLSHRTNVLRSHPGSQLEPHGDMVCMFPMFHMGAWTISLHQWQCRYAVIYVPTADAATIAGAVTRHRAARVNCIPAVWQRVLDLLATPEGAVYDLSSLRIVDTGTSATPLELLDAIRSAAPRAHLRVFYGSTEAGNVTMLDHGDVARKPGSCGTVSPFQELRVDEQGQLLVRGAVMFDGYFDDPDATAAAFDGDWFRTGDVVERDGEGFLTVVGRVRDVIRSGGETIAPAEVESVLASHPAVADVAVVGIPDDRWGELVCAVVVPRGSAPDVAELRAHCADRLAAFKQPRRVEVVDAIPRTASTGQVMRRALVQRLTGR